MHTSKIFTPNEVEELYASKINLPASYFIKYERLPKCPVRGWNYSWLNRDFPRTWCILDFKDWVVKHDITKVGRLGFTCESDPELEFVNGKDRVHLAYPPNDLHTLDPKLAGLFDFFIFNQTLEHLYNPFLAMRNIFDSLSPGGHMFTSVPTLNIPHLMPHHFCGFTPMGLAALCISVGFEIVESGQWGNLRYIKKLWKNHSWPDYKQLSTFGRVTNERDNVVQCWILAKKPLQTKD